MVNLEKILDKHLINRFDDVDRATFLKAMKEACNQVVDECVNSADLEYTAYEWEIPEGVVMTGDNEYGYHYISKDSILNVKKLIV